MSWFSRKNKAENTSSSQHDANFYLFFTEMNKSSAEAAEKIFAGSGYLTDLQLLDHKGVKQWALVLNRQVADLDEVRSLELSIIETTSELSGEYDGHEISV